MKRITSRGTQCGIFAKLKKKEKSKQFFKERNEAINVTKLIELRPINAKILKGKKGPISKEEKERAQRMFHMHMKEYGHKKSKAVELTAKFVGRSKRTINRILKEYNHYGYVMAGPFFRPNRKSYFDKLTVEERDLFRTVKVQEKQSTI